jgi:cytochrome c556
MSAMNPSDAYYRALLAYKKIISEQRDCRRDSRAFAEAAGDAALRVTRTVCTVDEAWIEAIEKGLVHIEKAIKEDRQFIYSNGEVIPIEKVKQVSKDSVEHLARHAELITRAPEGEDIIPDKLYTVERLSDYAVYENRFLYMLLCYLRDFVTLRYRKILELTGRYDGVLRLSHEATTLGRTVTVKLELEDTRQDDPYLRAHNPAGDLMDRMDLILKTVVAFLATPLMESAGKAAMLKPPIVKTNVLKMDNNFKGAVALYDYVIAYEGDGYTVTEETKTINAFGDSLREDTAEAELLLADLTYRYGLDLTPTLKANLERDDNETRLAELKARADALDTLRRRMERDGETPEAYALELERLTRSLRGELDRMDPLYTELETRRRTEIDLTESLGALTRRIEGFDEELNRAEEARLEAEAETEKRHIHATASLIESHTAEKAALSEEAEAERARHREEMNALREELNRKQTELDRVYAAYDELEAEKRLLHAQVMGQRARAKGVTSAEMEAMTDKDSFDELERELEAFVALYGKVWKETKRKIRKDLLNPKYIKGESGKK